MNKFDRCPCSSKALYHKCCKPLHDGAVPENALLLMRSRYSAYALSLADYIMDTTHPQHPEYSKDRRQWKLEIEQFCKHTRFDRLKINDFGDGDESASVSFTAYLRQADQDATFSEKSLFVKENGRWFYKSGEVKSERLL